MNNNIRKMELLLVEDDPQDCHELIAEIDKNEDFLLVGVTDNADKALELTLTYAPDAVILDLELHMGGGDGLSYLKKLREADVPRKPFVLVTTNNISAVIHRTARELGADFIMTKNQQGYSANAVTEFLKTTKSAVLLKTADFVAEPETRVLSEKRLQAKASNELNIIGIPTNSLGYKYLLDAILLVYGGTTQHLSVIIGKKYGKTESSVERAMQNAINRAWTHSDPDELLAHYTAKIRSDKAVPSITEFVFYYAQKLRNDY